MRPLCCAHSLNPVRRVVCWADHLQHYRDKRTVLSICRRHEAYVWGDDTPAR